MIANKTIIFLAIIFFVLNLTFALPIKKFAKTTANSFIHRKVKSTETFKVYRTLRHLVIYFRGKEQLESFQKQFSRHAIKYGSYYILLYNLIYFAFFIKSYFQDKQHKQQKMSQILSTYESRVELNGQHDLEEEQINKVVYFLQSNLWIMQKRKYSSLSIFNTEISILKVIYCENSKYKIFMSGVDQLGISDLCGVLTIKKQRMQIKIIKEYQDYFSFFTNQEWRAVIYQGSSGPDFNWQGQWYTIDYQSDPNHCGQWILRYKLCTSNAKQLFQTQFY